MGNKIVSLRYYQIEKQYKEYFGKLENINSALRMCGSAPKSMIDMKRVKLG